MADRAKGGGETVLRPIQQVVQVAATDTLVLPTNPRRKGVIFANNDPSSLIWVVPSIPGAVGTGLRLSITQGPLLIDGHDWGLLPAAEWHAAATLLAGPAGPVTTIGAQAALASCAALTTLASVTADAGQVATLVSATVANFTGAGQAVTLQLVVGATVTWLATFTAPGTFTGPVLIPATGIVRWRVTTAIAATTVDVTLTAVESVAPGAVPGTAALGVIEMEG